MNININEKIKLIEPNCYETYKSKLIWSYVKKYLIIEI